MRKLLQSKVKFGVCVMCVSLLSACASPYREKVTVEDILDFKTDCSKKYEQLAFLSSLMPTKAERQTAGLELGMFSIFSSDYYYKRDLASGNAAWHIRDVMEDVQRCPG